jgi:hypothetical protein
LRYRLYFCVSKPSFGRRLHEAEAGSRLTNGSCTMSLNSAVTSIPWPAMSPDLNPIEHIWDMLGRRIQAREPPVQNIRQLEAALNREWKPQAL